MDSKELVKWGKQKCVTFPKVCGVKEDTLEGHDAVYLEDLEKLFEGMHLVPREPTEAMMEAYKDAFISTERFNMKKVWRAMLDAYKGEDNG